MEFESLREKIIKLLRGCEEPLSVDDILYYFELAPSRRSEVYDHLLHIAKTIRQQSKDSENLVMIPPKCKVCGYIFKDLDKPRKPSKCPKCKSERIENPRFKIIKT
ncbi:MAG: transcriptional regulator [Candidatus Methanomethylicia archaeon]